MGGKRIFVVGFDLPGGEFEHVDFESDQTLLDADIILFRPTLGNADFAYNEEFNGKSILTPHSSSATKSRLGHWHSEIVAAVNSGRLVVVYLAKPLEYYRYTGEKRFSGTGRSRVTTNIVTEISSYEAIPKITKVIAKSGSEIRLEKDASYLATYWTQFADVSPYEVEIEGNFSKALLSSKVGSRKVGAAVHGKNGGSLLLLPPLAWDDDQFLREPEAGENEELEYWTEEALQFGKRLVSALVGLADLLKQSNAATPPPAWTGASEYRLILEDHLESEIATCVTQMDALQAQKISLETQLKDLGSLRGLLYEQGKPLEASILEAMKLFGFDAQPFSDSESEFDAVFVSAEGRCLEEAEGKDNRAINIDKFSQLERNLQEDFAKVHVTEYAKEFCLEMPIG